MEERSIRYSHLPLPPPQTHSIILFNNSINQTLPLKISLCTPLLHLNLSQNLLIDTLSPSSPASATSTSSATTSPALFPSLSEPSKTSKPSPSYSTSSIMSFRLLFNINLETLWLSGYNLVGPIPDSLGNLKSLRVLDLNMKKI